jgi:outer membrane protein TolC
MHRPAPPLALLLALLLNSLAAAGAGPVPGEVAAPALTLEAAVALALRESPVLEIARRELNVALLAAEQARPAFRPHVVASASQRLNTPRVDLPGRPDDVVVPGSHSRFEVELRQQLYQFGAGRAPEKRAEALALAAHAVFRRAELDLAREVHEAFLNAAYAESAAALALTGLEVARGGVAQTRLLVERGLQSQLDLLEAERSEAEAEAREIQARNAAVLAHAALNRHLGRPVASVIRCGDPGPLPGPPRSLDELLQVALQTRPELAVLHHNIAAAEAGIRLARASRLPRVDLEAGYALQTETVLNARSSAFGGVTISAPLFSAQALRYTVREAEERLAQLRASLAAQEQAVALEIEQQRLAIQEALARDAAAGRAIKAATQARDITILRRERGLATQLEVETARLNLERAQGEREGARHALRLAHARLARATGTLLASTPSR